MREERHTEKVKEQFERQSPRGDTKRLEGRDSLVGFVLGSGEGPCEPALGGMARHSPSPEEAALVLREAWSATCKEALASVHRNSKEDQRAAGHTWRDGERREDRGAEKG